MCYDNQPSVDMESIFKKLNRAKKNAMLYYKKTWQFLFEKKP